jgi:hypothetical protein
MRITGYTRLVRLLLGRFITLKPGSVRSQDCLYKRATSRRLYLIRLIHHTKGGLLNEF